MVNFVSYNANKFVQNEKAMRLHDSKGSKKNRLYLNDYQGVPGGAKIAVAAEIFTSMDANPTLGLIDRHFYFLYKVVEGKKTIHYKINRNSLLKRTGLKKTDVSHKDGNPTVAFLNKIASQIKAFQDKVTELLSKVHMLNLDSDDPFRELEHFERQFMNCLVSDPITRQYRAIFFYNTNATNKQDFSDYNYTCLNRNAEPKAFVIIRYDQASAKSCHTTEPSGAAPNNLQGEDVSFRMHSINALINSSNPHGPVVLVTVSKDEYDEIMAGKPLSSRLRTALEAN